MRIIHLDIVSSTQDVAKSFLKNKITDVLILADSQYSGRGRLNGRVWISLYGNFHGSFVINIKNLGLKENMSAILNNVSLDAILDVFLEFFKNSKLFKIKKPNDIMLNGKKVCGVLTEISYPYAIIGVGINLLKSPIEISTNIMDEFSLYISRHKLGYFIYKALIKRIKDEASGKI